MLKCSSRMGVFLLCAGHAINDFYQNFLPVLIPILIDKFGISLTMSGMLVMANSIAANIMQPFFGYTFDKHNASWVLLISIPLCGLTICSMEYASSEITMFAIAVLLGLTVSSFHPLGSSLIKQIVSEKNLGKAMSYYVAGGNVGFAFAPVVVVTFMEIFGYENLIFMAIPAVLLGWKMWQSRLHTIPSAQRAAVSGRAPSISDVLKQGNVLRLNFAMGLRCWTLTVVAVFLPLLMQTSGYSGMTSGIVLTIFLAGYASGGLAGGALGDQIGHKLIMVVTPLLAVLPTYYFFNNPSTEILSMIALFFAGAFLQAGQPSSMVWATKLMPQFVGVASGMMLGIAYGLGSLGTALTAAVGEHIGLLPAITASILPGVLASFVLMTVPYEK